MTVHSGLNHKMKTIELDGAALDWAVAKCEPDDTLAIYFDEDTGERLCRDDWESGQEYKPSTNWAQGGPIIEHSRFSRITTNLSGGYTVSIKKIIAHDDPELEDSIVWVHGVGPTILIASMRCYVKSKLGDEVEIPVGLT